MAKREIATDKSHPGMTAHSRRIVDANGMEWDALCNFGFGIHSAVPAGSPSGTPMRFVIISKSPRRIANALIACSPRSERSRT